MKYYLVTYASGCGETLYIESAFISGIHPIKFISDINSGVGQYKHRLLSWQIITKKEYDMYQNS